LWKPWRLSSPNGARGTKPSGVYVQLLKSLRIDHPGSWWSVFGGCFFTKDGALGVASFS
jgi:hypothetical protein